MLVEKLQPNDKGKPLRNSVRTSNFVLKFRVFFPHCFKFETLPGEEIPVAICTPELEKNNDVIDIQIILLTIHIIDNINILRLYNTRCVFCSICTLLPNICINYIANALFFQNILMFAIDVFHGCVICLLGHFREIQKYLQY